VPRDFPAAPAIAAQVARVADLIHAERFSDALELLEKIRRSFTDGSEGELAVSAAREVHFGDLLSSARSPLCVPVGLDAEGERVTCDLIQTGNLLVAGSNSTEKTAFLHSLICFLLMVTTPDDLLFHLTDTKMVGLTA
jgi:DNA segregation ATPase FtsK/SpoIIIE-like protein